MSTDDALMKKMEKMKTGLKQVGRDVQALDERVEVLESKVAQMATVINANQSRQPETHKGQTNHYYQQPKPAPHELKETAEQKKKESP